MKCLILGFQSSGKAAYELLKDDYEAFIYDDKIDTPNSISLEKLRTELPNFNLVVRSPGFPINSSRFAFIKMLAKEVISEMELGFRYLKGNKVIAVTGSEGKTTVVTLITNLLKSINVPVKTLGNIGIPLSQEVKNITPRDVVVLEVSSFQLEEIVTFKPNIAVITNLHPNHLDHVPDLNYYYASKKRLFLNCDGLLISEHNSLLDNTDYEDIYNENSDVYLKNQSVYYQNKEILNVNDLAKPSQYLLIDAAYALKVVMSLYGFKEEFIKEIKKFKGLEFREEEVDYEKFKVVNDSKSTSVASLKTCLNHYKQKRYIILGGIYKSQGIELVEFQDDDIIYLYGQDKEKLQKLIKRGKTCNDLNEVFRKIKNNFDKSRIIIFSPACSSLDQYKSFIERGRHFFKLCEELAYGTK